MDFILTNSQIKNIINLNSHIEDFIKINLQRGNIMNKRLRNFNGITLVALIVTIVILLILAGIAIATLGGENGLFKKVKLGKERYAISESKEK